MTKNNVVNKNTVNMTTDAFNNIIKTIGRYHPPNYSKFKNGIQNRIKQRNVY